MSFESSHRLSLLMRDSTFSLNIFDFVDFVSTCKCLLMISRYFPKIVDKKTDTGEYWVTTNDNEWYNEWQLVATIGTTSDNEWQQVTTSESEWQRVVISVKVPFFCQQYGVGMNILKTKRSFFITAEVIVNSSSRCI